MNSGKTKVAVFFFEYVLYIKGMQQTPQNLIPLTDHGLLAITGDDAPAFLQGMVTCDIRNVDEDTSLYGAHLTHQGRFLYDFFAFRLGGDIVLDCHKETLMAFAKSLHEHKMRFDIGFEDLTDDFDIFADITATQGQPGHTQELNGVYILTDPRLPAMGVRIVAPKGQMAGAGDLEDYHAYRVSLAVPDGAFDCVQAKTIAGEMCLEYLNGVDYKKGCYLGQEMTARTHFRNPPKKRLVAVRYEGDAPPPGADVKAGKLKVGQVFSCAQGKGIAILRVAKALANGAELSADKVKLQAEKPAWADYTVE